MATGTTPKIKSLPEDLNDGEDIQEPKDAEQAKRARTSKKSAHTRVCTRIYKHIQERASRAQLKGIREGFRVDYARCLESNEVYRSFLSDPDAISKCDIWKSALEKDHLAVENEIEAYFASRQGEAESLIVGSRASSRSSKSRSSVSKKSVSTALSELLKKQREHEESVIDRFANKMSEIIGKFTGDMQKQEKLQRSIDTSMDKFEGISRENKELNENFKLLNAQNKYLNEKVEMLSAKLGGQQIAEKCSEKLEAAGGTNSPSHVQQGSTTATSSTPTKNVENLNPDFTTNTSPILSELLERIQQTSTARKQGNRVSFAENVADTTFSADPTYQPAQPRHLQVSSTEQPQTTTSIAARLPRLQLKTFDGNPKDFKLFMESFMTTVHNTMSSDAIRLITLRGWLSQSVQDRIAESLQNPNQYHTALRRLEEEFGQTYAITRAHVETLKNLPSLKENDPDGLISFASKLHGTVAALKGAGKEIELKSSWVMQEIAIKLPNSLQMRWAVHMRRRSQEDLNVLDLDEWLQDYAKGADFLKTMREDINKSNASLKPKSKGFSKATINAAQEVANTNNKESKKTFKCFVCGQENEGQHPHRIRACKKFIDLTANQRHELITSKERCIHCLNSHRGKTCFHAERLCQVEGCGKKHNTLLHGASALTQIGTIAINSTSTNAIFFQIVPVTLVAGKKRLETHAFLDSGSDATLITLDASKALGLHGTHRTIRIKTFNGEVIPIPSTTINFSIESRDGRVKIPVKGAYSVPNLDIDNSAVRKPREGTKWSHLENITLPDVTNKQVTVLIGANVVAAHKQLDHREPEQQESGPSAFLTPFGWTLCGSSNSTNSSRRPQVAHIHSTYNEDDLQTLVERFWETDRAGVWPLAPPVLSEESRKGEVILKSTKKCINNRYEFGLMWSSPDLKFPDNREDAYKRFLSMERKCIANPTLGKKYAEVFEEYIRLGHMRLATSIELKLPNPRRFYLPHHAVVNPNKPGKVRPVFDARVLNKYLLKGPELLTNMFGILLRFRLGKIGLSADIEKMFHQVRVRPEDQQAFCLFWRTPGSSEPIKTHIMTVHVFGATSSPATAMFALRESAEDNRATYPHVADLVKTSFYVDNLIYSVDDEKEAIVIAKDLTAMLKLGGFRLTAWMSSSRKVLATIPSTELTTPKLNLDLDALPVERTLGLLWDADSDEFFFKTKPPIEVKRTTKRMFLSQLSSIFDPLGFASPLILTAKIIMQDIWRSNINWDDVLPQEIITRWQHWCKSLAMLENIRIPRYSKWSKSKQQLHVFCDASTSGFGAAAYLRTENETGVNVTLLMAKTHVAPVKQLSIARLELQGAVKGFDVASTITTELDTNIKEVVFHLDSLTVLKWIHSKTCKFHAFVGHRVGKILTTTDSGQWRFVPGILNPADILSRCLESGDESSLQTFLRGPNFLWSDPSGWPDGTIPQLDVDEPDPEIVRVHQIKLERQHPIAKWMARISSLTKLKRVVAWARRILIFNQKRHCTEDLTAREIYDAFVACILYVQQDAYPEELADLRRHGKVSSRSSVYRLCPWIDTNGIMRVGGRLEKAEHLTFSAKHQILLPRKHRFNELLVWHLHQGTHKKTEWLLAELRNEFWIPQGRRVIRSIINWCVKCKRVDAQPNIPRMAPLPLHRLVPFLPPFTHTGLDYFGPIIVCVGRRTEKRWVALFTCLNTRAVHLEVAHNMDTDHFLMCFQRFANRRTRPAVVYSDNGTNFVAGEKELREAFKQISTDAVYAKAANQGIEWHFSPPSGPHFGGVWERLVKSCKRAFKFVIGHKENRITDAVLLTALTDIEALLNSRPLTHVGVELDDLEPLTPNHFLLNRVQNYTPLALADADVTISKRKFMQAQEISQHFWQRWLKEFLPALTERKKWIEDKRPFQVNDLVLICDPSTPRGQWLTGRISKIEISADGRVRTASIKTVHGSYVRPVSRLCLLLAADYEESKSPEFKNIPVKSN